MDTCRNCGRQYSGGYNGFCSQGCKIRFELAEKEKRRIENQEWQERQEYKAQKKQEKMEYLSQKECNKWVALILCLFFGYFGAHKFYEGKSKMGVLYIFTMGLFGIGWLVDIIILLFRSNPYNPV